MTQIKKAQYISIEMVKEEHNGFCFERVIFYYCHLMNNIEERNLASLSLSPCSLNVNQYFFINAKLQVHGLYDIFSCKNSFILPVASFTRQFFHLLHLQKRPHLHINFLFTFGGKSDWSVDKIKVGSFTWRVTPYANSYA